MDVFDEVESAVRSYCRTWPVTFQHGRGSWLYDELGRGYLDFFAGAGTLNYDPNDPILKDALVGYITADGVAHSLDMHTVAKRELLEVFVKLLFDPRGLTYRMQFTGPTGASAVEAALRLARKATGRTDVVSFHNAFHGMSLGARLVSDSRISGPDEAIGRPGVVRVPFGEPGLTAFNAAIADRPAAVILETVQAEGGAHAAPTGWLAEVVDQCRANGVLVIADDVQMGCGRTGPFFSFEPAGIEPDIVCLSKAVSGYGLPMAVVLVRPELDVWAPGEHSGTFRGYNHGFVTARAALETYWSDEALESSTRAKGERGLLVETAGPNGEVVKIIPPLTVTDEELDTGLRLLGEAVTAACDVHAGEACCIPATVQPLNNHRI